MAQVSELDEDVFGARTAEYRGVRSAECGMRTSAGVRSAECGRPVSAEPVDVCGVRSADRVQGADCRLRGRPMSAERGVLRSTEFCCII